MSYFFNLRGSLEVPFDRHTEVTDYLQGLQAQHHAEQVWRTFVQGWCWNSHTYAGTGYVFYGQRVKEDALQAFESVLKSVTALGCGISGQFQADGEDGTISCIYTIVEDEVCSEQSVSQ